MSLLPFLHHGQHERESLRTQLANQDVYAVQTEVRHGLDPGSWRSLTRRHLPVFHRWAVLKGRTAKDVADAEPVQADVIQSPFALPRGTFRPLPAGAPRVASFSSRRRCARAFCVSDLLPSGMRIAAISAAAASDPAAPNSPRPEGAGSNADCTTLIDNHTKES